MLKLVKNIDEETKLCREVFIGTDVEWAFTQGYEEQEVEEAYNGAWYLEGFAPQKPAPSYKEQRMAAYPPVGEQLDMIYWDKVNGTNLWQEMIANIKTTYPKA